VPVVREVKCTNVQRDAKMQNEQALAQGAVMFSAPHTVLCPNVSPNCPEDFVEMSYGI
jgi:hypothetical protein